LQEFPALKGDPATSANCNCQQQFASYCFSHTHLGYFTVQQFFSILLPVAINSAHLSLTKFSGDPEPLNGTGGDIQ